MKNIAVLVYTLMNEYTGTIIEGITSFFADKSDYRLIISGVHVPHSAISDYDYQYWCSTKILESQQIDGVILVQNTFTNFIKLNDLAIALEGFTERPVVSVSGPVSLNNNRYTYNTCDNAYIQVVEHLKNKHGCKRFAFFTANLGDSFDSKIRYEAFLNALTVNNIDFYPELVFDGDFTPGTAEQVILEHVHSKDDLNFDALICVNDYTAAGSITAFDKLGIKVPEDVKIFGFDDSDISLLTYPTVSSISQTISLNGYTSAEMLYVMLEGEDVPEMVEIPSFPLYRQSCGCVDCKSHTTSYYDANGKFFEMDERARNKEIKSLQTFHNALYEIYQFINAMDSKISMENIIEVLHPSMTVARLSALMICLYEKPFEMSLTSDYNLPKSAKVQIAVNLETDYLASFPFGEGIPVDIYERIAPEEFDILGGGTYYLHPLFLHNINYGYFLCKSNSKDNLVQSINLKLMSEIILQAYAYSNELKERQLLLENNGSLILQARTDELTKVFNRRGIYEYGQQMIDLNCSMNKQGLVFFCDLDGLKKINDTWGHKIGDLAIKTEAEVLKATFRESDFVGRLSGDEFCVVAPGLTLDRVQDMREKLIENNKIYSEKAGLPFILSISIGGIEFTPEKNNIQQLLQEADQHLYEEKHIKHAQK